MKDHRLVGAAPGWKERVAAPVSLQSAAQNRASPGWRGTASYWINFSSTSAEVRPVDPLQHQETRGLF